MTVFLKNLVIPLADVFGDCFKFRMWAFIFVSFEVTIEFYIIVCYDCI